VAIIRELRGGITFRNVNHLGTAKVAQAAKSAGVRHLVLMSALGARAEERYRYAHTKWLGEQEVMRSGVPYTILRPSILFGEGDEFFNTLAAVVKLFPVLPVAGSGESRFQPVAVEDVARCVALVVCNQQYYGRILEFGGPRQYTYDQLMDLVTRVLGVRRLRVHVPLPAMRLIAGLMEAALPRPPVTREQLKYLELDNVAQVDSVERHFGFAPRSLEQGLGYLRDLRWRDALAINAGFMPRRVRDH
jgi:NADH dehydrogenase